MNQQWSFYRLSDGHFTPRRLLSMSSREQARETLALNTPEGCAAIEGQYNRFSQRVDLATGEVVADDTLAAGRDDQRRRDAAVAAIAELERRQLRPLRELQLDPGSREAYVKLRETESQIAELRAQL